MPKPSLAYPKFKLNTMSHISLNINGNAHTLEVEDRVLLADVLRDNLKLTGTHVGCDTSQCGCCTVLMNGDAVKSCTVLAVQANGAQITTIEGLANGANLHPIQVAFSNCHALQCGFCTPGMIMATAGLLANNPQPTDAQIHEGLAGNLCRCTGYINIVESVKQAAKVMQEKQA
jgi:carbon-monoxide dehydrogenase small subunit